jgi:hypothetical protein
MDDRLSEEERDILKRFERGELRATPEAEREMEIARGAARKSQLPDRPDQKGEES